MNKISILFLSAILLLTSLCSSFALTPDEAKDYVGKFCYIKYYKYEYSSVEHYNKVVGKVFNILLDDAWKIIVIDYKAEIFIIRVDKIKQIQIIESYE